MHSFQKVLCPIDFSTPSLKALEAAGRFASFYGAQLILLHVVSFPAPNVLEYPNEWEAERFAVHEAERGLRQIISEHLPESVNALPLVRIGDAAVEIGHAVFQEGADIIVMSTHGRTGWRRLAYGSVAAAVVRNESVPVLTVGSDALESHSGFAEPGQTEAGTQPWLRRILCPTDLSEESLRALSLASALAADFTAQLCILHVIDELEPALGIVPAEEFEAFRTEAAREEIREKVLARIDKGIRPRIKVKAGRPAAWINAIAKEGSCDLIVMATHGLTGWRPLILGSVALEVMNSNRGLILLAGHNAPSSAQDLTKPQVRRNEQTQESRNAP